MQGWHNAVFDPKCPCRRSDDGPRCGRGGEQHCQAPGCGCCEQWAVHVRQQFARNAQIIPDARRGAIQRKMGVPADLRSCHTAIIDGMALEGHVPIADVKRALA